MTTSRMIPLASIRAGGNDRKLFRDDEIASLAASIDANGLAQPITVRPVQVESLLGLSGSDAGACERFEIVAGERRYRAHVLLGRETIECLVREYDDRQASDVMLAENTARADLGPFEEADAYTARMGRYDLSAAEVASVAGVSTHRVTERLRLLRLVPEARALVASTVHGALPIGHASRMADLDGNRQALMLAAWVESGATLSRSAWSTLVAERQAEQDQESMFDADSFLQVADMVAGAAKALPTAAVLRKHLQAAVRALESAGLESELCADIRSTWAQSWDIPTLDGSRRRGMWFVPKSERGTSLDDEEVA